MEVSDLHAQLTSLTQRTLTMDEQERVHIAKVRACHGNTELRAEAESWPSGTLSSPVSSSSLCPGTSSSSSGTSSSSSSTGITSRISSISTSGSSSAVGVPPQVLLKLETGVNANSDIDFMGGQDFGQVFQGMEEVVVVELPGPSARSHALLPLNEHRVQPNLLTSLLTDTPGAWCAHERAHGAAAAAAAIKTAPERTFRPEDSFPHVSSSQLYVCQVCGDISSGVHYGVVTCGSCKVFFKRSAAGRQNLLCASGNNCTIDRLRRKNCASCRLRKCFMLGMMLKGRKLEGAGQKRAKKRPVPAAGVSGDMRRKSGMFQALATAVPLNQLIYQSLLSVLQVIEPTMVNAGHDSAQSDSSVSLLNSLNQLGERQLVNMVSWAKTIPGFCDLHVDDQLSTIQLSWMGVMVLSLGWRSYALTNSSMLYFAPDLVYNDEQMQVSSMKDQFVRIKQISQMICKLQVTYEEFLCMKALVLLSIMPLHPGSQHRFEELRTFYMKELQRVAREHACKWRMFQLTQLLDHFQMVVTRLHEFTYDLFLRAQSQQTCVTYPEMLSEIMSVQLPKILSGVVKPILFHSTEGNSADFS